MGTVNTFVLALRGVRLASAIFTKTARFAVASVARTRSAISVQATESVSELSSALSEWQAESVRQGKKPKNAHKQATRLGTLFASAGWHDLSDLTRENIVAQLRAVSANGRKVKTAGTLQSQLSAFCKFLTESGKINFNPCATIPPPKHARGATRRLGVRSLTSDEVRRVVAAAERDEQSKKPRFCAKRSSLYRLMSLTGARYGQLVRSLRWGDIDLERGTIVFDRADAKTARGQWLPLHPDAVDLLAKMKESRPLETASDFVFPRTVQDRVIKADLAAAGIPATDHTGRAASFHSFRKFFASELVAAGVPVNVAQRLMQHSTVQMTLEIYAEVRDSGLADALSTIQTFATNRDKNNFTKISPNAPKPLAEGGEIADTYTDASDRSFQHQFHSSGGSPLDRLHFPAGRPSDDRNLWESRGYGERLRSPGSERDGRFESAPRHSDGQEQGGSDREIALRLIDLATRLLSGSPKGEPGGKTQH